VEPAGQSCVDGHKGPRKIFLQRNGDMRQRITKKTRGHKKEMKMYEYNGGGRGRQEGKYIYQLTHLESSM
jgi:hypothetical protein